MRVEPKTLVAREAVRRRYRPVRVRILFVGEAPPASGRFFYQSDSGLYRAMRGAFIREFPVLENQNFLEQFQALGCYLTDLCARPVDHLDRNERMRACMRGEVRLVKTLRQHRPKIVVSIVRSIAMNVNRARKRADWVGRYLDLPYPGRWRHHQIQFEEALRPVLRAELSVATQ